MHIMTSNGWFELTPKTLERTPYAPELYTGPLPPLETQAFIRGAVREHNEWVERRRALTGEERENATKISERNYSPQSA